MNVTIRCNLIILFLCSSVFADPDVAASFDYSKALNQYKIGKNFKGFAYSSKVQKDAKTLYIQSMPMQEESKRFTGLWINIDAKGLIQEIGPVFKKTHVNQDVLLWAFDNYYEKRINFDTLWCVTRAANLKKLDEKSLLLFILDTINNSPRGNELLSKTKIKSGDESWRVVKKMLPDTQKEILLSTVLSEILK